MKKIFKYVLKPTDLQTIKMHPGDILKVGTQCDTVCIWALVDPNAPTEERTFAVVGTGHECQYTKDQYLGTVGIDNDRLIFHVFEIL